MAVCWCLRRCNLMWALRGSCRSRGSSGAGSRESGVGSRNERRSIQAPVREHGIGGPIAMHANRLINEKSPYLQQHAHNPVDWHPWGPEAFEKARREDKPIFLSIGYSSCHWCHVMEHEYFESDTIA